MELFIVAGAFIFGLMLGSFINVLVYRFPLFLAGNGMRVFSGRSHCDNCAQKLLWHELVPLLSFLFLRGKCRVCRKAIPIRYFAVELAVGVVFLLLAKSFFLNFLLNGVPTALFSPFYLWLLHIFALLVGVFALLAIFFIDLEYFYIPDTALFMLFGAGIMESFIRLSLAEGDIFYLAVSMTVVFIFFFSLWFFSKGRAMGFGDVKLAPLLPLFLGAAQGIFAIIWGFWLGALISLFLLAIRKKHLKDTIPLGPFLVAGTLLMLLWPAGIQAIFYLLSFSH